MERSRILWLTSWYPSKEDLFYGDFIQRHARAASIYNDIHVIYVTEGNINPTFEEEFIYSAGLTEQIIYCKKSNLLGWMNKQVNYFIYFKKAIKEYINKNGMPSLIHIHIPWKSGLLALWIKRKYNIRYLITEHWGIYNEVVEHNIKTKSLLARIALKHIYQQADLFISVSKFLGEGVKRMVVNKNYIIMPNVVDTSLFHPVLNSQKNIFTFIHVSNDAAIKNIDGIIEAFSCLIKELQLNNVRLLIVGSKDPDLNIRADNAGLLNKNIFLIGEVSYPEVAKEMNQANVLVMFSHMENSPCVIGEALCCGIPVIATHVGGIPELVDSTNSILIEPNNTEALKNAMNQIIKEYYKFNKKAIATEAIKKFSYDTISRQFQQIYFLMKSPE